LLSNTLAHIARHYLNSSDRPVVGGERPHITLTTDVDTFRNGKGTVCELDHTGPVPPQTAHRMACDASITRMVIAGPSEPLDVGRRTPVIPPAMRRALLVRDRHRRFLYCRRPPQWCEGHHIVHWSKGGPTALANLTLLCVRHHHVVHQSGGFTLILEDGRPAFRRPDGSVLKEFAPP
jgi:hypothetical protein